MYIYMNNLNHDIPLPACFACILKIRGSWNSSQILPNQVFYHEWWGMVYRVTFSASGLLFHHLSFPKVQQTRGFSTTIKQGWFIGIQKTTAYEIIPMQLGRKSSAIYIYTSNHKGVHWQVAHQGGCRCGPETQYLGPAWYHLWRIVSQNV